MVTTTVTAQLQKLYQDLVKNNNIRARNANKKPRYFLLGVENIGAKHCIEDFAKLNNLTDFKKQGRKAIEADGNIVFMLGYIYPGEQQNTMYAKHEVKGYNEMLSLLVESFAGLKAPKKRTKAAALKARKH